jgi:mannosyltransferase OCH1-like enzyme
MIIGNALMASVPKHDLIKAVIDEIFYNQKPMPNSSLHVMENTGPFMLTRLYRRYNNKAGITLLPAELVTPLTMSEVRKVLQGQNIKSLEEKIDKSFALHYFWGSWHSQL